MSLNTPTSMLIDSFATDLNGNPISSIPLGQSFLIETDVQDTRQPTSQFPGVFSAYANLQYTPDNLISIPSQTPVAGPGFARSPPAPVDLSTPGMVPGVGTFYELARAVRTRTSISCGRSWPRPLPPAR